MAIFRDYKGRFIKGSSNPWNKNIKGITNSGSFLRGQTPWNKGKQFEYKPRPARQGISPWNTGKKGLCLNTGKTHFKKGQTIGDKNNNWKGGITSINHALRTSLDFKLWREAVFKRDKYTCVKCGVRNGNGKRVVLNADHIKRFADFPKLRFDINNGQTLCKECHLLKTQEEGKVYWKNQFNYSSQVL